MPWNCLSASKNKRKLEISAPILNVEDYSNFHVIPSNQQRSNIKKNSSNNSSSTKRKQERRKHNKGNLENNQSKLQSKNVHINKEDKSKQKKAKLLYIKEDSSSSGEENKPRISKNDAVDESRCSCRRIDRRIYRNSALIEVKIDENIKETDKETVQIDNANADNYETIPIVCNEKLSGELLEINAESEIFNGDLIEAENLEDNPGLNDHNTRYITLQPCNVGSLRTHSERFRSDEAKKYLNQLNQNYTVNNEIYIEEKDETQSTSIQHSFKFWEPPTGKICQICHESLSLGNVVKCYNCDLVCHSWCSYSLPSIRYHDTSFIIYRKWLKGQEELAFPSIHRFITELQRSNSKLKQHLKNNESVNYSKIAINPKHDNNNEDHNRASQLQQSKFDEKCKSQEKIDKNHKKDDQNNNSVKKEGMTLHIVESNSSDSMKSNTSQQKNASGVQIDSKKLIDDQQQQPNYDILLIEENEQTKDEQSSEVSLREKSGNVTPGSRDSYTSNTSDGTITEEICNKPLRGPPRKVYKRGVCTSITDTSSMDETSDGTVDYEFVDLRRTKSNDEVVHENIPKSRSFSLKPQRHYQQQLPQTLRLHYVTQRIFASVLPQRENFPGNKIQSGLQDKYEREVISMLEQKHGKNYRIFDLESCISIITLERICELCKHIDKWLNSGQDKVVVLQDREDRQRLGVAIAAYLEYLEICSSNFGVQHKGLNEDARAHNTIAKNWLALDVFSMKKFLEDFIGPLRIPSHKRYLKYFSGLLSGNIKMNSSSLNLRHISIESPPTWFQFDKSSPQTEWSTFLKIYEGLHCVYTSDIHIIPITTRQIIFQIGNLRLRGDILIRCYQVHVPDDEFVQQTRELLFSLQFHTCAITSRDLIFPKDQLDYAFDDSRFPSDHKVSLHFGKGAESDNEYLFQTPLIRTEPPNELAKVDSIEHFDLNSSYHTQGPLDGSLYATILKSSKLQQIPNQNSSLQYQRNSINQSYISPPSQFSNKQQYEFVERRPVSSSSFPLNLDQRKRGDTVPANSGSGGGSLRSHSQSRSDYSFIESRPGTSQSHCRDKLYINQYPRGNQQQQQQQHQQQINLVQTYRSGETVSGQNYPNGGREYARSPLTISMDSGISSSGALNRPQLGSSVSPSSFPSQASPQGDRHRELDDILSVMLMTVQDIPDFNKSYKKQTSEKITRSQSVIPTSNSSCSYTLPPPSSTTSLSTNYLCGGDTVKRSQSYTCRETSSTLEPRNYSYLSKDRGDRGDLYDNSSTATTLTPPPSESGRDTPTAATTITTISDRGNIPPPIQHQKIKREQSETIITSNNIYQHYLQQGIEMDSQYRHHQHQHQHHQQHDQSTGYPRSGGVTITSVSEDEDIPYHAREHSQPFSYGNVPLNGQLQLEAVPSGDPDMIKMPSGLSSPSLVRKTFGGSPGSGGSTQSTLRKTSPRNDFEDMLRERREKLLSEKYSISDQPPTPQPSKTFERSSFDDRNKYSSEDVRYQRNGYYYNEPLKRSNTLEGFYRSNSTDGLTGQTWLQLQQQKLRAKKNQQLRDDRRYFEENVCTEIRNRPLKSRAYVQRYDGYASDTAAFADEVDYRRPLQVQVRSNRSPERNYHTITTTTTVTKEHPFIARKHVNDQAQRDIVASAPLSSHPVLNISPNDRISQIQNQNGLLSMTKSSTNRNFGLESELMTKFQDDNNSVACINNNNVNDTYNNINNNSNSNKNSHNGTDHHQHPSHHYINFYYNENEQMIDENDTGDLSSIVACGQLALDRLLASIAVETDIMDRELAQTNDDYRKEDNPILDNDDDDDDVSDLGQNVTDADSATAINPPQNRYETRNDSINQKQQRNALHINSINSAKDEELMNVIADLVDYNTLEDLRRTNNYSYDCSDNIIMNNNNNNFNNNNNYHASPTGLQHHLHTDQENNSHSPSISDRSNFIPWHDQAREDSYASYRSETDPELHFANSPRPETPAFPVTPRTPYNLNGNVSPALPPKSPTSQRRDLYTGTQKGHLHEIVNQNDTISSYTSRRNSNTSNANSEPHEVAPHHVKFVRDSSKYWYKPNITREEAIALLRNATPGTFIVRDSTTFKNAFGLVLRVAHPPPGVQSKGNDELVRHFLVEPTSRGVRLKGCANEPVFTSLSALVYQHSITPLALPCRLIIPDSDIQAIDVHSPAQKQLLTQGAACNVYYLYSCGTESLTGEEAIRKAVSQLYSSRPLPTPTEVHFKVSQQGITLTDNTRQKFFRKHYATNMISYIGLDPDKRLWNIRAPEGETPVNNKTIFAFVARRSASSIDNLCHVFCDLQIEQPATAIVSFANKILPTEKIINQHI